MNILGLNYNIEQHKYLEILRGGDKIIVLYSDNGTEITKETHQFSSKSVDDGIVEAGMVTCSIVREKATGTWEERYRLDYTTESETDEETSTEQEETSTEQENE